LESLTIDNLQLFILFVTPGFISLKVWTLIHPSPRMILTERIMEAIIFSSLNYLVIIWLHSLLKDSNYGIWIYFLIALILSVIYPFLLKKILLSSILKNKVNSIMPKAWDYFFHKKEPCFVLIHLKDGKVIGGFYGDNSFASSYPEENDIYLEEIWKINERGAFADKIDRTNGLLVNKDAIEYIEFFKINDKEEALKENNNQLKEGEDL